MAAPSAVDMQTYAARLASFEGPRQVAKRRASNTKKKQPQTVSWPHKSPTPQELAEAGFFYKPTADSQDSVTCFLCGKSLDGWESGDQPAQEHLNHVPDCGWAVNVCIGLRREVEDRAEEDPMSEALVEARTATFMDAWPHESKKGWKPKVKKMVEAGWCYSPLPDYDDCVMCFYCGTSLDGWEPKDDPSKEHRQRADDCHFFTLVEASKKLNKSKSKKTRGSKASRVSTMSTNTVDSEQPSFSAVDNDEAVAEDVSMLSTASTASKTTRGRPRTARGKASRATKAGKGDVDDVPVAEAVAEEVPLDEPSEKPAKKGRQKREVAQKDSDITMADDEPEVKPKKAPARKRTTKQAQKDSSIIEPDSSMVLNQTETQPTRGRKRNSEGEEKLDSSVIVMDGKPTTKGPAKGRSKRAATKKQIVEQPVFEDALPDPIESRAVAAEPADHSEPETQQVPEPVLEKPTRQKPATQKKTVSQKKMPVVVANEPEVEMSAEMAVPDASAAESKSQAVAQSPSSYNTREARSPSAQSSDAENVPPSARPSAARREPLSPSPSHINVAAAQTPRTSPSKRSKMVGGLQTTAPWSSVDLDTIFLNSPGATNAWAPQAISLEKVLDTLTSPERKMTVEEWILANASKAETQLKQECERMIVRFEDEGNRAVRAVEGVECSS